MSEFNKVMGHYCSGGGAEINNSPIVVNITIVNKEPSKTKEIVNTVKCFFQRRGKGETRRIRTIDNAQRLSSEELREVLDSRLFDG